MLKGIPLLYQVFFPLPVHYEMCQGPSAFVYSPSEPQMEEDLPPLNMYGKLCLCSLRMLSSSLQCFVLSFCSLGEGNLDGLRDTLR